MSTTTDEAEVSVTSFSVEYDGASLREGLMDVRELAPALLSLGALCEDANFVLNGDRAKLSVQVRANFKRGSFGITLDVVQTVLHPVQTFLTSQAIHDGKEILENLGFLKDIVADIVIGGIATVHSLVGLVRHVKGRKIEKVQEDKHTGVTTLHIEGNVTLNVTTNVYRLYTRQDVRKDLSGVLKPLEVKGVDVVRFVKDGEINEAIDRDERLYFESPETDESDSIDVSESVRVLEVRAPSFDPDLQWRFYEGVDTPLNAYIVDERFWKKIRAGESFKLGDLLRVRIQTEVKRVLGQARARVEHIIVEVIGKLPEPQMLPLDEPPGPK